MSPIGRVFIVLNLILAGTFVGFAGTYLQRQDNYKKQYESEKDARAKENAQATKEKADLTEKVNHGELDKTQLQNQLNSVKNEKDALADENKVMNGRLTSMEADYKAMNSSFNGIRSTAFSSRPNSISLFRRACQTRTGWRRGRRQRPGNRIHRLSSIPLTVLRRDATTCGSVILCTPSYSENTAPRLNSSNATTNE